MFWIGFILPFLWIIGAVIDPTERATNVPRARYRRETRAETSMHWRGHDTYNVQNPTAGGDGIAEADTEGGAASVGGRAGRARQGGAGRGAALQSRGV